MSRRKQQQQQPSPTEIKLKQIVSTTFGCDEDEITSSADFIEDLGADSLDKVELVMEIEEAFDIEIDDIEADNVRTFGELVELVTKASTPATP